jgi:S1-C subfamily serine protease
METKKKDSVLEKSIKISLIATFIVVAISACLVIFPKITGYVSSLFNGKEVITNENIKIVSEENVVIDVVEKSKDSVVSVALTRTELEKGVGIVDKSDKIGTGFVVDKSGLIITNQHVVSIANQKYKVITSEGKSYDVEDIVIDDSNDIAILKVKADDLKPIKLGDSSKLKVGQLVIAIGTPLGEYAGSVTTGVISGLNRSVTTQSGSFWSQTSKTYEDVIQTDAAINPGNSGGPLLNSAGEVIGVNFATTSSADNISFALPANRVTQRLDEYRKFGKFIKPYLGVEYEMITQYDELYYPNVKAGAYILRVVANSPASKAGLKKGDIITDFSGKKVTGALSSMISDQKVGDEVKIKVYRDSKSIELTIKLEESK